MNKESLKKTLIIIKAIAEENGKIEEDLLMQKLAESGIFESSPCGDQIALPEAELILQNLIFSNIIKIHIEKLFENLWVPASTSRQIILTRDDIPLIR